MMELGFEPSLVWGQSPRISCHQVPLKAEAALLPRSPGPPFPLSIVDAIYPFTSCHKHTTQPHQDPPRREEVCWYNCLGQPEGEDKNLDGVRCPVHTAPTIESTFPHTLAHPGSGHRGATPLPGPLPPVSSHSHRQVPDQLSHRAGEGQGLGQH